ncbi:MAG: hemolysin secretion protein D [Haliea sp.]|nr:hemolysin secretion protein D [Haliea sp.]|tara:strand:+ start:47543 stop:48850 length:1308 start_codon:yes stop_codon:yes gene_type:complete
MTGAGAANPDWVSDRRYRRIGWMIVLVTFGLFGGWAALAPLDSAALAPGVVTVEEARKTIQHPEGGIVQTIHVSEGARVAAGDPLISLDATQWQAERSLLRGQYASLLAEEARLQAERQQLERIVYPEPLRGREDRRAQSAMTSQEALFQARRDAHAGERAVLEQRIEQLQAQIAGIEAVRESNLSLLQSFDRELADLRRLQEQGYTGKQRITELERERSQLIGENAEALSRMSGNQIRIGETRLEIIQLERHRQSQIADELETVQARLYDVEERLRVIEDRVERAVIRAPVAGLILGLQVTTVGGVISAGTPLLDIVPDSRRLIVEAEVSPVDIDRVQAGVDARIRFTAFKAATTLVAEGTVETLSADRLLREDGSPYYLARVAVELESLSAHDRGRLVPGMPADVLITTGERTLLQYLLQPARNVMARALIED